MDSEARPDRRPLLYGIAGVLILALAIFLFRPQGGAEDLPETLVLTPQQSDEALHASVEEGDADAMPQDEAAPADESPEAPETVEVPDESFSAKDTQLEAKPANKTPEARPAAKVSTVEATPVPRLTGSYFLVVGSYGDPQNAQRTVGQLDRSGVPAEIHSSSGKNGTVHRVRVGYFRSREDADTFGRKLKRDMDLDYWIASR